MITKKPLGHSSLPCAVPSQQVAGRVPAASILVTLLVPFLWHRVSGALRVKRASQVSLAWMGWMPRANWYSILFSYLSCASVHAANSAPTPLSTSHPCFFYPPYNSGAELIVCHCHFTFNCTACLLSTGKVKDILTCFSQLYIIINSSHLFLNNLIHPSV